MIKQLKRKIYHSITGHNYRVARVNNKIACIINQSARRQMWGTVCQFTILAADVVVRGYSPEGAVFKPNKFQCCIRQKTFLERTFIKLENLFVNILLNISGKIIYVHILIWINEFFYLFSRNTKNSLFVTIKPVKWRT